MCRGDSSSRSSSPEKEARIEYITSFGGEDKQKQGDNHPASSSRGGGGATGSVATRKGGASGSSRSGGMGGGRRDSGRGDGIRRRSGSTSRSRYSEREWRSDNRRHRCVCVVWCGVVWCGVCVCGVCGSLCMMCV